MSAPFISVVIPVRDGEPHLRDCLAALRRLDYPADRHELLVVDNGSRDGSAAVAREFGVRCVHEPLQGAARARNAGAAAARGELLAFVDCDCRPATSWLAELAAEFARDGADALAGEIVSMPPRCAAQRYAARRKPLWQQWTERGRRSVHLVGANCALRRETFQAVGGFDPAFGASCEDVDLSLRLQRAGARVRPARRALVFHEHRATVRGLATQHFNYARGQARLARVHALQPAWGPAAEARAWLDLGRAALRLGGALLRRRPSAEHEAIDLVRRSAQRLGFARGLLEARVAGARRAP